MTSACEYARELRAKTGMSWGDLEEATGYPESTIRDHVTGRIKKPNEQLLIAVIGAMGGDATRVRGIPQELRADLAEIRKAQAENDELRLTIETMRRIRGEMLEQQRESYEAQIKRIDEKHEREIARIEKTATVRLRICICLVILLAIMMLATIGILVYDFTHLDRGWFQMFSAVGTRGALKTTLRSAADFMADIFH